MGERKRSRPVPEVFLFLFSFPVYHGFVFSVKFLSWEFSQVGEMFTGFSQFGEVLCLVCFCDRLVVVLFFFSGSLFSLVRVDTKKHPHVKYS